MPMSDFDSAQAAAAQPPPVNGNPRTTAADQQAPASAAFSPFAGVTALQVQPPPPAAPQPTPDWSLPLLAAVLGLACIAAMLRRLLD